LKTLGIIVWVIGLLRFNFFELRFDYIFLLNQILRLFNLRLLLGVLLIVRNRNIEDTLEKFHNEVDNYSPEN